MPGEKEKILYILRKTRKAYIVEYTCCIFLLVLLVLLGLEGIIIKAEVKYFVFGLTLISVAIPEYKRMVTKYVITDSKIIFTYGLIRQAKMNVYFKALGFILNINFQQSRIQRLLNYGTIHLAQTTSNDPHSNFEIKNIDNPHFILTVLESLIEKNRPSGSVVPEEPRMH